MSAFFRSFRVDKPAIRPLGDDQVAQDEQNEVASLQFERMQARIAQLERDNKKLKKERDAQQRSLVSLSRVVKAGEDVDRMEQLEDEFLAGEVISADDALELTISNLREQVECMEDERETFIKTIVSLEATVHELTSQNEAKDCKIQALKQIYEAVKTSSAVSTRTELLSDDSLSTISDDSPKPKTLSFRARGVSVKEERDRQATLKPFL